MITSSAPIHHIHSTSTMWRHRGSRASNPTLGYQIFVALHCTPLLTMYTHYLTTRARMKRGPAHMNDNEPKTSRRPIRPACIESASNDRGRVRSRRRPHRRANKSNGPWAMEIRAFDDVLHTTRAAGNLATLLPLCLCICRSSVSLA